MDKLVAKYATSKVSFDQSSFHEDSVHDWNAALQFAQPSFDIPMVSNVGPPLYPYLDFALQETSNLKFSFLLPFPSIAQKHKSSSPPTFFVHTPMPQRSTASGSSTVPPL